MKPGSIVKCVAQAVVLAFAVNAASFAQQGGRAAPPAPKAVARLANVEGNVLSSNPSGLSAGSKGLVLFEGQRVITATKSKAVVEFDDGCVITLEPNQRYVVDSSRPCNMRFAQVQSTLPQPTVASTPPADGLANAALSGSLDGQIGALAVGVLGVIAYDRMRRDETVSPN
ncbi:MAG: hypothetical protein IPP91_04945 [Betaproteobacteria bacterium]|nr:hypothetical protein [Betaproteobacteria bacterium]